MFRRSASLASPHRKSFAAILSVSSVPLGHTNRSVSAQGLCSWRFACRSHRTIRIRVRIAAESHDTIWRPPRWAGIVPLEIIEKCRKIFLTVFGNFCPAKKMSKSVETFLTLLTFFDVAPFRWPLLRSTEQCHLGENPISRAILGATPGMWSSPCGRRCSPVPNDYWRQRWATTPCPGEIQKGTGGRGRNRICHKLS